MHSLNVTKIISILAFLGLAGFSCYWTAESIYMTQPSFTIYGAWMIAIVFFIIASICFGQILKALDREEDFYGKLFGRTGALLLGFFGLMVFWLAFSLPTNTHTLLYNSSVKNILTSDLTRTLGYLERLQNNNLAINAIDEKYISKHNMVIGLLTKLKEEINRPEAQGIGKLFEQTLNEIELTLAVDNSSIEKINRRQNPGNSYRDWIVTYNYYESQVLAQLSNYRNSCQAEIERLKKTMGSEELSKLIFNTKKSLDDVSKMKGVSEPIVEAAINDLANDYTYISKNSENIEFKGNDKELYTRPGAVSEAAAMQDVVDVWKDYIYTDKYDGHSFGWLVLLALLVDIAGFIFFNMAFNSKNNNAIS